jgi:hypothetical protein
MRGCFALLQEPLSATSSQVSAISRSI